MKEAAYTVSQDTRSGMWYAHMKGYAYVPIAGSFSKMQSEAKEYAKMYNGLPNRVEEIEQERREKFYESLGME